MYNGYCGNSTEGEQIDPEYVCEPEWLAGTTDAMDGRPFVVLRGEPPDTGSDSGGSTYDMEVKMGVGWCKLYMSAAIG